MGGSWFCRGWIVDRPLQILYGQSIGGAVSIDLASRNPEAVGSPIISEVPLQVSHLLSLIQIRALILENTFMTLPSLIPSALPFLSPFAFLCHQKWESANKLPKIPVTTPILMLSGLQDEVVPTEQMKGLWEIAQKRRTTRSSVFSKVGSPILLRYPASETSHSWKGADGGHGEAIDGTGKSKFIEFPEGHHSTFMCDHPYPVAD